jgi:hypothetical protein
LSPGGTEQYGFRVILKTDKAIYKQITEISNFMNNKLLVGRILCDLERWSDCIDYGIVLITVLYLSRYCIDHGIVLITVSYYLN